MKIFQKFYTHYEIFTTYTQALSCILPVTAIIESFSSTTIIVEISLSDSSPLKRLYPNVNTRVTLPFVVVTLVLAGIAIFMVTQLVGGNIQDRINNQLVESAQVASNGIVELERQYLAVLRLMAFTEGLPDAIQPPDPAQLQTLLAGIVANEGVDEALLFDTEGALIVRLVNPNTRDSASSPDPDLSTWDSITRIRQLDRDDLGDKFVQVVREGEGATFYFVGAVTRADGAFVGGIAVGVHSTTLISLLRDQTLAEITLFTADGAVLDTTLRANRDALPLPPERAAALRSREDGVSEVESTTFNGIPYQQLYANFDIRSESIGVMSVAFPVGFVSDRVDTSRNTFILLFVILFMIVVVLGVLVARSIIQPVFQMLQTTRAINSGDLSQRVNLAIPDELGELGRSFDHMTDQLVQRNQQINSLYLAQVQETVQRDAVLSSISDAVIVMNTRDEPLLLNDAARTILNALTYHGEDHARFSSIFQETASGEGQTVQLLGRYFSTLLTPVRMPSGERLGYVLVLRDISDIIEAEKLKDELIMQLSHELRTPLTSAKGYAELLQYTSAAKFNDQEKMLLSRSLDNLNILRDMVNQVIEVSAILADRIELTLEDVDLTQMIYELVAQHRSALNDAQIRPFVVLPDEPIHIRADFERLRHALDHIFRNGYYYNLSGGWVEIGVKQERDQLSVYVADSGVGIDEDEQAKVFERMYRGRSADAGPTDKRGLGLGLYISRQIITAHGGTITLTSKREAGTVVTIQLPYQYAEYAGQL